MCISPTIQGNTLHKICSNFSFSHLLGNKILFLESLQSVGIELPGKTLYNLMFGTLIFLFFSDSYCFLNTSSDSRAFQIYSLKYYYLKLWCKAGQSIYCMVEIAVDFEAGRFRLKSFLCFFLTGGKSPLNLVLQDPHLQNRNNKIICHIYFTRLL